ncbi:MAG: GAF domain-containing protein [Calditrichaeota bacterium]|nr:MAG: GAF domain-containing protein [Calditrichota bacterium]
MQNKNGLSFCIFYEAKIYSSKKNYAKSLECFDKAISLAEGLNHSHYLAQFSLEKAELLYENGEFKEVKRLVQKSLEITENGDFEVFYYKINNLTNLLKFEEGKHEEAIHFFKMVSEKSKQENITSDALFYITKLGIKSYDLGTKVLSLDEIDSYKEKAIEKAELLFKESNVLLYKIRAEKLKTLVFRPKTVSPDLLKSLVKWMNPETAFSEILGFLTDEYKANGCQIILKNEKTNEFETCAISSKLQDEEIDYSSGILSKAIENQKAILIEDATHTEQFQENLSVVGKAFLSVIAVPLEISGKICGALYLQRTKIKFGFFSKEDLKQVEDIAKVLSPILLRQQEALKLKIESEIRGLGIFVGNSLKMQELYSAIENASKVNFPVYIHGETGTGKELVAGALHKLSNRNSKPFVVLNCATIPKDLAESELFGHEKGSFTGAISVKRGKFELSNGGTLFLDEIGELSLELQAKFLRAIQEKEITRVGGEKAVKIDLRVIVATHKNLENEVKKGNFREDLYHRLNVLKIEVPPLRERSEDIPLLANFFLEKLCKDAGKKVAGLTPDSLILLQEQNWSGNVRELENTIAKGLVMKKDNLPINPKELGFVQKNQPTKQIRTSESEDFAGDTLDEKLDFVMKKILASELKKNSGNKSKTAITLDVKREKLYRLLKKHNL